MENKYEMNPEDMPKTLIFQRNQIDPIGEEAELMKVKDSYAYYGICKGSSSKMFVVYISHQKLNQCDFFTDREILKEVVIDRLEKDIKFIKEKL